MPTKALTSQKIADRKAKAWAARQRLQVPPPVMPPQSKARELQAPRVKLTIRPNEANQASDRKTSMAHVTKPPLKGISQMKPSRMERLEMTSV